LRALPLGDEHASRQLGILRLRANGLGGKCQKLRAMSRV
jgi:hypothetical protein